MTTAILEPKKPKTIKSLLKTVAWSAASSTSFCGLFPWKLEDHMMLVERIDMPIKGLGQSFVGTKIAHIADLHMGPAVLESYLRQHVERINEEQVDFVVIAGDLITGGKDMARKVSGVLKHLQPRLATIVALGNHDYGLWHPKGLGAMRGLGDYLIGCLNNVGLLADRNRCHTFTKNGDAIQIVSVDEIWANTYNPAAAFENARPEIPSIALIHNPDGAPELASRGAQWVLAGHTHGIGTPQTRFHKYVFPADHMEFVSGHYTLKCSRHLYVNRGIGHSLRWNIDQMPEITIFTLTDDPTKSK